MLAATNAVPRQEGFEVIGAGGLGKFDKEARKIRVGLDAIGAGSFDVDDRLTTSFRSALPGRFIAPKRSQRRSNYCAMRQHPVGAEIKAQERDVMMRLI